MNSDYSSIGVFASWNIEFFEGCPYVADMHYPYIEYLCAHYSKVVVVTSSKDVQDKPQSVALSCHNNLIIARLPYLPRYLDAIKYIRRIIKVLSKALHDIDLVYCRVPDPLCWCPAVLFKKKVIMDFVGDTIDCAIHNEKWGWLKKSMMIAGYLPEYLMTIIAARKSVKVVTAGEKLAISLNKYGVKAKPLVPSLLSEVDIPLELRTIQRSPSVKLVYVGYIRYAKGIYTLMEVCRILKTKGVVFELNVVGVGELFEDFKQFITNNAFNNIHLLGFVESRKEMNDIMYSSDLFIFPSLSEGAPRVVIEAMAQGVPVISTPVGALPYLFKDKDTIRFFNYNDAESVARIICDFIASPNAFITQRDKAYDLVRNNYTKEKFFDQLFSL